MERRCDGYTAKEDRRDSFVSFDSFCGREVASEFGVCCGSLWFFAETLMAADAEESDLGKRHKSIMKKLGSERRKRQAECGECMSRKRQHCMEIFPQKDLSVLVLHITEEMQTTAAPIHLRSLAFSLCLSLPPYTSTY